MRHWFAVLAVGASVLAAPADASAQFTDKLYHGTTARGAEVQLVTYEADRVESATVRWTARCRQFEEPAELFSTAEVLPRTSDRREFSVVTTSRLDSDDVRLRSPATAKVELALTGRRRRVPGRPGAESWIGTVEATIEIRADARPNRLLERCGMRRTAVRVWREGLGTGTWAMNGDPGETLLDGRPRSFDRTNSTMVAYGNREEITVAVESGVDDWFASFTAPENGALVKGARYTVSRDAIGPPEPARMRLSSSAPRCNGHSGEFTVNDARYNERGRLRSLRLSFVHFCDTTPALRGTLAWRASR
ncbi:MAG: hypothetical protein AVDCRST_MAG85-2205 [uncultured Solirubrobacteraceae bacterium]|uniref:Uncharacterized protein n=1 Tax=uncultured Solirubrobacteraceae bacterium TaxID=1162706 RepID=A0A6J4SYL0_9ACTN|nr:MAG: hypothetical protein AVDCRST_MAG85-2205 [uncultured Solirubrobacteraceae bacterium]